MLRSFLLIVATVLIFTVRCTHLHSGAFGAMGIPSKPWPYSVAGTFRGIARLRGTATLLLCCAGVMALLTIPGVAAQTTTDYDQDDDGLIEVNSLARLNAIRWDLDGDGVADQVYWDHDGNPSTLVQIDASATRG